jgi:hypothetical protein
MPSATAYGGAGGYDSPYSANNNTTSPGAPLAFPQPHGGRDAGQEYAYPTRAPSQYQPGSRNPHYISMPTPQPPAPAGAGGPTYPPMAVAPMSAPPQQAAPSIPYYQQHQQQEDEHEHSPTGLPYAQSRSPDKRDVNTGGGAGHWIPPLDTGGSISVPAGQSSFYNAATQAQAQQQKSSRHRHIPSDTTHYQSQPNSSARPQLPQPPLHQSSGSEGRFNAHPAVLAPGAVGQAQGISPANATIAGGASPSYQDAYDANAYDQYYHTEPPQDLQAAGGIPYNSQQRDERHTPAPTYNTYGDSQAPYQSYGGGNNMYHR